ncbi:hypothetical protein ACFW2E_47610, partial [Streptomyces sp. NPDC058964]
MPRRLVGRAFAAGTADRMPLPDVVRAASGGGGPPQGAGGGARPPAGPGRGRARPDRQAPPARAGGRAPH